MTTHSLSAIKATSIARDTEEKKSENREKAMLLFTYSLLIEKGYLESANCLSSECSLSLDEYSICENIDLRTIFVDFEAYYQLRFQKSPQYFRKPNKGLITGETLAKIAKNGLMKERSSTGKKLIKKSFTKEESSSLEAESPSTEQFKGPAIGPFGDSCINRRDNEEKLIKPISVLDFGSDDLHNFAEMIQREIVVNNLKTKWNDVIGLHNAKSILQETLIQGREFIEFFGDALSPWKNLLLFGPPGVGKTLLAKAVASECKTTFFNISSSSIVSKWRGESEKIVKVLFELARFHAPSTIFFDEFDALGSKRDSPNETDASRRLKSEILQQMDGILAGQNQNSIFILAATNLPWELDPAILRRMEKRIFVPLPNYEERSQILGFQFQKIGESIKETSRGRNALITQLDYEFLSLSTEGYSGSDLHQICKESVIRKFRNIVSEKNNPRRLLIQTEDVIISIQSTAPTVNSKLYEKFHYWENDYP